MFGRDFSLWKKCAFFREAKKLRAEKLLFLLLLLQVLIHYSLINYHFGDEGYYLTWAWLTNRGELIYQDTFHMYSPGPTLLLALFFKIFGASLATAHLLVTLVEVALTVTIFALARKIFGEKEAFIASTVFVISEVPFWGSWMLAEPFMTLFLALGAFFVYEYYFVNKDWKILFAAGILLGLSAVFKQTGIYVFLAFLLYAWLQNRKNNHNFKRDAALLVLGCTIPLALTAFAFFLLGALPEMIYNILIFNLLTHAHVLMFPMTLVQLPYIILVLAPVAYVLLKKKENPRFSFLLIWFFGGLLDAFPSAVWAYHYFPTLPPAAILIGYALKDFSEEAKRAVKSRSALHFDDFRKTLVFELLAISILCVGVHALALQVDYKSFLLDRYANISSYIRSNTDESDKILAYPIAPSIYFFSQREPASYYPAFCCGINDTNKEIIDTIIHDIDENKPPYIIVAESPLFIPIANRSHRFQTYLASNYHEEKIFYLSEDFSYVFRVMKKNAPVYNSTY